MRPAHSAAADCGRGPHADRPSPASVPAWQGSPFTPSAGAAPAAGSDLPLRPHTTSGGTDRTCSWQRPAGAGWAGRPLGRRLAWVGLRRQRETGALVRATDTVLGGGGRRGDRLEPHWALLPPPGGAFHALHPRMGDRASWVKRLPSRHVTQQRQQPAASPAGTVAGQSGQEPSNFQMAVPRPRGRPAPSWPETAAEAPASTQGQSDILTLLS